MMKGLHAWLTKKNASQVGVVAVVAVAEAAATRRAAKVSR